MASYFIDPASGTDDTAAGRGDTAGDPWKTVQFALDNTTAVAAGDQFNIKAGTADTLTAALSLTSYGTPDYNSPLTFRGYTSAENDGGIGDINGGGSYAIIAGTPQGTNFLDMRLHNTGANDVVTIGLYGSVLRCEIDTTTGSAVIASTYSSVCDCNIHTYDSYGVSVAASAEVRGCYFADVDTGSTAIYLNGHSASAHFNVLSLSGGASGIETRQYANKVSNNSILSSSGTGKGITTTNGAFLKGICANNIISGFNGSGGIGINIGAEWSTPLIGFNAVYQCSTPYSATTTVIWSEDNETLGASPFDLSGSDTFANRFTYFAPVDTGNVHGGAMPVGCRVDKGAVQHADPAGGGTLIMPSRPNSLLRR